MTFKCACSKKGYDHVLSFEGGTWTLKKQNLRDEKPTFVNLGAQKNFAKYAERIGKEWEKNPSKFGEFYYRCSIARAIIFKRTENLVSSQPWYQGGYRANIVAYSLAMLSEYCKTHNKSLDLPQIWKKQCLSPATINAIRLIGKLVSDDILLKRKYSNFQ